MRFCSSGLPGPTFVFEYAKETDFPVLLVDEGKSLAPEGSYLFFAGAPGEALLLEARRGCPFSLPLSSHLSGNRHVPVSGP